MATSLVNFSPAVVRASAVSDRRKSDDTSRRQMSNRSSTGPPSSASNLWSPLFGWSSDPDYIDTGNGKNASSAGGGDPPATEDRAPTARLKFVPGCFTEEKAKQLRLMTTGMETFHDVMYHSAIASRLASDFSRRSDR